MRQEPISERSAFVHAISGASDERINEMLTRIQRDLDDMAEGLSLAGLKRCSWCKKYLQAKPGALFGSGGLVCFSCIPTWWLHRRGQLGVEERSEAERKLVFWLRTHHQAEVVKQSGKKSAAHRQRPRMVATCLQCNGTGTHLGEDRCRYCDGLGAVWVIVHGWASVNTDAALLAEWKSDVANQS